MRKSSLSLKARALSMLAQREHSRAELRRKLLPFARAAALAAAQEQALTQMQMQMQPQALAQARPGHAEGAGDQAAAVSATGALPTLANLQDELQEKLHRSPGPAPARPGIFSSTQARPPAKAGLRRSGWKGRGRDQADAGMDDADPRAPREADVGTDDRDAPEAGQAVAQALAGVDTAAAWAAAESAVDELLDWLQAQRHLSEQRFVESRVHARAARFGNLRIRQELAQHGVALDDDEAQRLRDSELERCRAVWARKFGGAPPTDAAQRVRQMRFLAGRGFSADVIRRVLQAGEE